jgi:ribose 5-phosphate isomerase B
MTSQNPSSTPTVFIASDHAAVSLKAALQKLIPNVRWSDIGPQDTASVDYPDYAEKLCAQVRTTPGSMGILICGSGIGMSIAANKIAGIRAALVENPVSARLAREHNDANVLCLGARFLAAEYAAEIAQVFLKTAASKDPRHCARVEKLNRLDLTRTN